MKITLVLITSFLCFNITYAQVSARLFQHPDVSETAITFVYGGDIWTVAKEGGVASKLSSPAGQEVFPRFSPDGSMIAFSGNYDGNMDVYVVPSKGGIPTRVTHHGMSDRLLDWCPDGQHLLYASSKESGKQRFSQIYKVSKGGGMSEKLPMAYAEFGSMSPDGKQIAFTDRSRMFRTWKRYRGGTAADVWIFNLETLASKNITDNIANDELPMWFGDQIYYLSDQGDEQRFNLWVYDIKSGKNEQITFFKDFDIHFPAIGPKEIVFEAGGKLLLFNLTSRETSEVDVQIGTDLMSIMPRKESVEKYASNMAISPDGNRVAIEARGEVFSLPAEKGYTQNLTRTPGVAERFPAWSPDGRFIAYWSDKSGEYELTVRDLKEGAKEKKLTSIGPGFRYQLYWAPDSKKLSFVDQTMTIQMYDMETNTMYRVDQDIALFEGGLRSWQPSWSADSGWLAYSKTMGNGNSAIFIYNTKSKKITQATNGFYSDLNPTFGPDGKYLYCLTNRSFKPVYSDFDNSWSYPNATQLAVLTLRTDVLSPLSTENDTVAIKIEEKVAEKDSDEKKDEADKKIEEVKIDFDNLERRLVVLPPKAGNIGNISATSDKVIFQRSPSAGSIGEKAALMYFDLKKREEKTILEAVNNYQLSANGEKLLVQKDGQYGIIEVGPDAKMEKTLALKEMEMTVDPRQEWEQIFLDAWRFERDFFYDIGMHGVDWDAMKEQYGSLIQYAMNRNDVNFILGELIGELNSSHTYRGGGDDETPKHKEVGYLGVDWEKANGQFKIKKIVRGAEWDNEVRSPLDEPGIAIKEGDYILAVNGVALNEYPDPFTAFEGLSGKTIELTFNSNPSWENAQTAVVKTMDDETRLRNLAWIESNRKRVDEASGGKIGYIYVPSTGVDGQNELVRQFYGQWNKEGLIVDERFNNGGQIPDRFIELLNRKPLAYWSVRDGENWQWPPVAHFGAMAMLTNGWSGSGGDAFPDYFRKAGLGAIIGGRTWGGLIGVSGAPPLIDGGAVTVPTFRMYNPDGTWFKEGHGVDPDIEVKEDPTSLAKGIDTQLEAAIEQVKKQMQANGPIHPEEPPREDRNKKIKP